MNSFLIVFLIAISLSMDAFSLSLAYSLEKIDNKYKMLLPIVVGSYHFIMPLIGMIFSNLITNSLIVNINIIAAIVLFLIGLDLIISKEDNKLIINNIITILLFGLTVSMDSLSIGMIIKAITINFIGSFLLFSIISSIFTYFGLYLGNIISQKIGNLSKLLGGTILIIIAIITLKNSIY